MDIENKSENEAKAKRSLVFAITVNIVLLVFFKYFGFLVESTNTLFGISIPYRELALPIGISFYTFQEISYIVDVYRGKVKSTAKSGEVCAVCIHVSAAGCRTNRLLWRY